MLWNVMRNSFSVCPLVRLSWLVPLDSAEDSKTYGQRYHRDVQFHIKYPSSRDEVVSALLKEIKRINGYADVWLQSTTGITWSRSEVYLHVLYQDRWVNYGEFGFSLDCSGVIRYLFPRITVLSKCDEEIDLVDKLAVFRNVEQIELAIGRAAMNPGWRYRRALSWCERNHWYDIIFVNNRFYAFSPDSVIPIPIPETSCRT